MSDQPNAQDEFKADAGSTDVCGGKRCGGLRLPVRDSGQGFDMADHRERPGLGLISMQERARLVDASITIKSELGEGTMVTVVAPLPADRTTKEATP